MNKTKGDEICDDKCYNGNDLVLKHHTGAKWPFISKFCALEDFFQHQSMKRKTWKMLTEVKTFNPIMRTAFLINNNNAYLK